MVGNPLEIVASSVLKSSKIFLYLWLFSEVVGNLRRSSEVFRNVRQSSEGVDKSMEIQILWRRKISHILLKKPWQEYLFDLLSKEEVYCLFLLYLFQLTFDINKEFFEVLVAIFGYSISDSNWTEWSIIQGLIEWVISKLDVGKHKVSWKLQAWVLPQLYDMRSNY